ncbi:MAG: DDE-type integrase/transposase/recombinase [Clostridium sp.]|uniref:DDE-type integrase/transposase/recombinase n=1 Tax=Clostridium sp. TaxID=1506 RepID=UPI003F2C384B
MVAVDFHTRLVLGVVLDDKRGTTVVDFLVDLCRMSKKPEEYVTDNGKEFENESFKEMCRRMNIKHRKVSIDSYRSNGRVG